MLERRVVRFGGTGGLASFTHIVVAFSWLYLLSSSVFIANIVGFLCAFGLSYLLQSRFVFQVKITTQNAKRFLWFNSVHSWCHNFLARSSKTVITMFACCLWYS
ncbi:GtrA family protein [Enterovibrio baiacu]|uniref:GtrA family protein n=1 Tax=Enterovibrio baiacu TaxID=2491023 RepID=UPI003D105706